MLKEIFKLLFHREKGECYDKYIGREITLGMRVPYKGRKYKVILTAIPLSFCNDGFFSKSNGFKSYGKKYSYVEDFSITNISFVGESVSKKMVKELVTLIYTTNDLFDMVCDSIISYIHEEEVERKFYEEG